MKQCVVGIRRPDEMEVATKGKDAPMVWFPSMATKAVVLSEDNRTLLLIIENARPKTPSKLAALSGRQVPNLSRTLRMMASYRLVSHKRNIREIEPTALSIESLIVLG